LFCSDLSFEKLDTKLNESIIPIINIDSKQVSSGVGVILLRLLDLIKENKKMEEYTKVQMK